ncbi:hypothetical protein [Streptomyces kanamyceticus]|uniref:Uncharacterized protein n=1 Tax=Streptomyces kanamyceticus TaxID=1967 RepID=A0A5J6GBI4_STRKN|nr:hypothetical protein [Streptomyces kanamyceticus]QEU91355.1 hypothetical protein CP970_11080 [Streptomyces kanamyceticus]
MAVRLGRKPYIARRLGVPPRLRGSISGETCPDIFELSTGEFAFIGTDVTESLRHALPPGLACGQDQRIVVITRETLLRARSDIPDA